MSNSRTLKITGVGNSKLVMGTTFDVQVTRIDGEAGTPITQAIIDNLRTLNVPSTSTTQPYSADYVNSVALAPSNNVVDVIIESGVTWEAIANGYLMVVGRFATTATTIRQLTIMNDKVAPLYYFGFTLSVFYDGLYEFYCTAPVTKGQKIRCSLDNAVNMVSKFVYAKGGNQCI